MKDFIATLQDPKWVAKFQQTFGIEIIKQLENNKDHKWLPIEVTENSGEGVGARDKGKYNIIFYKIHNRFWYFFFKFGSFLGGEIFYALFFSFLVWNLDAVIGRRVFLVAYFVFYIGQVLKEVLRCPRPAMPPAVRLELRWDNEFGLPSTHSMMAAALPLSLSLLTSDKQYWSLCLALGTFAFLLVTTCRLYLGMHTVLDILAGILLSALILVFALPLASYSDEFLLTSPLSPFLTLGVTLLIVRLYPTQSYYTPSRGETALLISAYNGLLIGSWISFKLGKLEQRPITGLEETGNTVMMAVARQLVGVLVQSLIYLTVKPATQHIACALMNTKLQHLRSQEFHVKNHKKITVDLISKFITFFSIGLSATTISPELFRVLGCDRPKYWSEVF